ncbi:hypothetical protein ASD05_19335, partial [Variovorax sp. Root434]
MHMDLHHIVATAVLAEHRLRHPVDQRRQRHMRVLHQRGLQRGSAMRGEIAHQLLAERGARSRGACARPVAIAIAVTRHPRPVIALRVAGLRTAAVIPRP